MDLTVSQRLLGLMFVYAAIAGFFLGAVYDLLRISRLLCGMDGAKKAMWPQRILLFAEDFLFAVVASLTLILLLYYTNDGQLRVLAAVGMGSGFFVYYHTVGRLVMRVSAFIVRALRRLIRLTVKLILWPFRQLGRLIGLLAVALWRVTGGKAMEKRREKQTEAAVKQLIERASHGFSTEKKHQNGE